MKTKNTAGPRLLTNRLLPALSVAAVALFVSAPASKAQTVLAGWDFDPLTGGSGNYGPSPLSLTTTGANLTAVGLTRGSGIGTTGTGAGNAWGGNDMQTTSSANAIAGNDFVTFSLTANAGFEMSLSSFSAYNVRRSGTGPTSGLWQYQIGSGSFTDIGSTITWGSVTTSAGNPQSSINLSGISALQNVAASTTVTFRLALWGGTAVGGTWYLNDPSGTPGNDFIVNGTIAASGGGGTDYFWTGGDGSLGGSGTWATTGTTWSATNSPITEVVWDPSKKAIFTNTAGTVTVSTVSANAGILFANTGYSLTNGTLTLGGASVGVNSITTDSGVTTTIGSVLAGTTGMTKAGAGTLVLSGANTFSGGIALNAGGLSVGSAGNLGAATNDLTFGGGTLVVTSGFTTGSSADFTGSGAIDIAPSQALQVDGLFNMSALTLTNTGTLDLNGATRNVGALTLGGAATIDAAGAVTVTSINAAGLTSGTALINNAVVFSITNDQTVNVGTGGTLEVAGNISGITGRIIKLGEGTLEVNGSNSGGGFRLGAAGTTNGGTLVVGAAAAMGTNTFQFNYGTLQASTPMTITNDLSIGGREGTGAVVGGTSAIEFSGNVGWFNTNATTTNSYLGVDNSTTLSGVISNAINTNVVDGLKLVVGGAGTLTMSGASANVFTNDLVITNTLTVNLNKSTNTTAVGGNVTVNSGATLLVSASGQVVDTSVVTLSGGTIQRASGVSETFGDLNLAAASTLNYVGGSAGTLQFGIYEGDAAPDFVLTLNNFGQGNRLIFANDLSAYIDASFVGTSFSNDYFAINGMAAAGFTSAWNGSTFTITAIPEPSTYAAAAGLLGLMLWPARRRILRDTQRILGLRGAMRDRLERLRA